MPTLSVPLSQSADAFIKDQVKRGRAASKADVVRKALQLMAEEEAVAAVLRAQQEPSLEGELDELAKKLRVKR